MKEVNIRVNTMAIIHKTIYLHILNVTEASPWKKLRDESEQTIWNYWREQLTEEEYTEEKNK